MSDNNTPIATKNEATDLINLKILLNGTVISGEYGVVGVNVLKSYNKIASAKIILADGDPAKQDFIISSNDAGLVPGNEVEIQLGYHSKATTIFKGIVTSHSLKSGKNKHSALIIEAKDKAIKLTFGRKNHYFIDKNDSEIIEKIAKSVGYGSGDLDLETTKVKHKDMVQFDSFDWDFMVSRAEMNGLLVLTDNNKLIVKKPNFSQDSSKEITFGVDVIAFESCIDGKSQLEEVRGFAWNYQDQKVRESQEAKTDFKESGNLKATELANKLGVKAEHLVHVGSVNDDELLAWGNARLLKSRMAKTMGKITVKGLSEIKIGQIVKLSGFSKRFNGNVLVTGISQHYDDSIWETDIHFGMPEQWFYKREDIIEKPASGMIPGINGLQIGIVIQLENDPDKQDRVKIQLPLVDTNDGLWARVACMDAGKDRGCFFRPELRDEVIVGFLNDDPRYPIILGMLNSSTKPAPFASKDTNHEKGFVTRSKMKIVFNDEKKSILIETPKGKKIEIDDDKDEIKLSDQHRNSILLSADGIIIESGKDISLKAKTGNIQLEGINIEHKAKAKFSAEGSANSELKSSGVTVVKGSIVNIN
jgi:Rhs element Vgr protein